MISRETKEEIRSRIDIVDLIGSYVALKRGGGRYKGLCPFHKEKTPSFHVQPDRQMYYCFGCGKGGDIFSFLMDHDGMDFNTAIRMLADKAGVMIEEEQTRGPKDGPDKRELFQTMEKCTAGFHEQLKTAPEAQVARDYLDLRHLDAQLLKDWKIGFALPGYRALRDWAEKEKAPEKHLHLTGMLAESDRGGGRDPVYERFRGRLMFPIQDEMGRTVGFSGRVLDPESKGAKYVNTPETSLFHKSKLLYGLGKARKSIHDREFALLCEGQIDVIRCHAAGFTQAVAPQGTSLTEEHVHILKRHTERVVLTFDSDSAGSKAAIRASELMLAAEMMVDIIQLPEGEDPDSLIRQSGADAMDVCIEEAQPAVLFYARKLREADHLDNPAYRAQSIRRLLEFINRSPSAVQKEQMVQQLSEAVGMSVTALQTDLNRLANKRFTSLREEPKPAPVVSETVPDEPAERELIGLLLDAPGLAEMVFSYLQPEHISHPVCRRIFDLALAEPEIDADHMLQLAGGDDAATRLIAELRMDSKNQAYKDFTPEDAAKELILRIRAKEMVRRRFSYRERISNPAESHSEALRTECQQITLDLGVLKNGWAAAEPLLSWKGENPLQNT